MRRREGDKGEMGGRGGPGRKAGRKGRRVVEEGGERREKGGR